MKIAGIIPLILFVGGCCCAPPAPKPAWTGPTDTLAKVVADINANNSKIPTLSARHAYEANVIDEKGHAHFVSGEGNLLYQGPANLRLTAESVAGTVFDIGSNPQSFWLKLGPEAGDTMWWGMYEDFAGLDPDHIGIPIRPDMVLDVLGITTINKNLSELPAPVMRFDPQADAYVLTWTGKLPDRWVALREVWYDRLSKRPKLILMYDTNGRVALRCVPSAYVQVAIEGMPKAQWPWTPGDYKLTFPDSGSKLGFTLNEVELRHRSGSLLLPVARSFRMPNPQGAGVSRVIQIGKPAGNDGK